MYMFACKPAQDSIPRFLEFDELVSPLQDSRATAPRDEMDHTVSRLGLRGGIAADSNPLYLSIVYLRWT
jgi:hypothetical protein